SKRLGGLWAAPRPWTGGGSADMRPPSQEVGALGRGEYTAGAERDATSAGQSRGRESCCTLARRASEGGPCWGVSLVPGFTTSQPLRGLAYLDSPARRFVADDR